MSEKYTVPEPTDFNEKEVYTFFGLAGYWAQVFEREIMHFAVALETQSAELLTSEFMDSLFYKMEKKTIGRLLTLARGLTKIPEGLDSLLQKANEKRVDLVHHFFFRNSENFLSEKGRIQMINELRNVTSLFIEGNEKLETVTLKIMGKYGITPELIESEYNTMKSRAKKRDVES